MTEVISKKDTDPEFFYSIAAPGVLRTNANYNVAVNVLEAHHQCEFKIKIFGDTFLIEDTLSVEPMSSEIVSFKIPNLSPDENYYLETEVNNDPECYEKIQLLIEVGDPLVYIQLDKAAYKRGDKMDFRIIFLENELLRPMQVGKIICYCIKFADKLIFEEYDIQLDQGVYIDHWQVPEDTPHGSYDIQVFIDDNLITSKNFGIIDFNPQKFELKILTVDKLIYTDKQLLIGVEATYSDGTPVCGVCKLELECVAGYFNDVYIEKSMPIKGKIECTIIDIVEDLDIDKLFVESEWFETATIMVKATVTNESDASKETLTKLVTLKRNENVETSNDCTDWCCTSDTDCRKRSEVQLDSYDKSMKDDNFIKIIGPKNDAILGEMLDFSIELKKPAKYCLVVITARGNIIKCELINVDNFSKPITRSLEATLLLVPRAFILAYFIFNGVLYFDEIGFNLAREFENELTLKMAQTSQPEAVIPIEIQSAPNSLIGLKAVDLKSVLLKGKNDLSYKQIFNDLYYVRSQVPEMNASGRYPGLMSGVLTITNATMDGLEKENDADRRYSFFIDREHFENDDWEPRIDIEARKKKIIRLMQEQQQVYGNLLFKNTKTNNLGNQNLDITLPKISSTWMLTVFSINDEKGFAMTKAPFKITTMDPSAIESKASTVDKTYFLVKSIEQEFVIDHYEKGLLNQKFTLESNSQIDAMETTLVIKKNLFGAVIKHFKNFAGKMYCTGYLHMTTVLPNIVVLEFLDYSKQLDSELALDIKKRLPESIERETADYTVGWFSWFRSDSTGSPLVTSLVLQNFQRISKYIDFDESIMDRGLSYLASTQLETGEFEKESQSYKNLFQKDSSVGLTAFVLLAFLKDKHVEKYEEIIKKGFQYIISHIEKVTCNYDLALAFYALQVAGHSYSENLKSRLLKLATLDVQNNQMWWTYFSESITDTEHYTPVSDLEVTSYILLALSETEPMTTLLPIIKWILPLRDLRSESMDMGIALDAVLKAAIKGGITSGVINLNFKAINDNSVYEAEIEASPTNSQKILVHVLLNPTNSLEISVAGHGTLSASVACYHKKQMENK